MRHPRGHSACDPVHLSVLVCVCVRAHFCVCVCVCGVCGALGKGLWSMFLFLGGFVCL